MPLLDHFRPPLSQTHPWRSFHGTLASSIARHLNGAILPSGYYAAPFLERDDPDPIKFDPATGTLLEWANLGCVQVEIHTNNGDPDSELVAVIEFASPRCKDCPESRKAFTTKCVDYLRSGCGLVVVDLDIVRKADLQTDLFRVLGVDPLPEIQGSVVAISYQPVDLNDDCRLQAWPRTLELGQELPTLPLWLGLDFAVSLDLELCYAAACADLRIRS